MRSVGLDPEALLLAGKRSPHEALPRPGVDEDQEESKG